MADYYPLLSRALEALSDTSPEMRNSVYERARSALSDQLRGMQPALPASDLARERRTLDEAIQRIEAEYAARAAAAEQAAAEFPEATRSPPPVRSGPERSGSDRAAAGRTGLRARGTPEALPHAEDLDAVGTAPEPQRERPRVDTVAPSVAQPGRRRSIILGSVLAGVIGAIAVTALLLRDRPVEPPPQAPVVATPAPPPEADRKIAERVGGERPPAAGAPAAPPATPPTAGSPPAAPAARADLAVAQRAMLYEENAADPRQPRVSPARVLWRLDNVNAGQGQALETVVRAAVDVSSVGMTLNVVIRRNLDQTLPASHTVELAFQTPPNDTGRAVRDVAVLQVKNEEAERGTPMTGLPVRVKDNLFLIGLSNLPPEVVERNTELLRRRNWIDLPILFTSGQRAILSFEKGASGEQVIEEAFQRWQ